MAILGQKDLSKIAEQYGKIVDKKDAKEMLKNARSLVKWLEQRVEEEKREHTPLQAWNEGVYPSAVLEMKALHNQGHIPFCIYQDLSLDVYVGYAIVMTDEWKLTELPLGVFPEHPDGWTKSYTPLPRIPPQKVWSDKYLLFDTDGSCHFANDNFAPEGVMMNVWKNTLGRQRVYPQHLAKLLKFERPTES